MSRIKFMNTEIDNLTMSQALDDIEHLIHLKKDAYVVTPNVDHIVQLETDEELREVYRHADLILCDGKPLIWISKLYGTPIKEKISGSDLFPLLCKRAAFKEYKLFFLGGAKGIAKKAAINLKKKIPGLKVVGAYSPAFGFEKDSKQLKKTIQIVQKAKPDILIVGLGAPKQEKFIYHYRKELNVPVSLGLGASLDFEAGKIKRAPKWMSNHGLEWLYRITQDPQRLAKRYLGNDTKIIDLFFKYRKNNEIK